MYKCKNCNVIFDEPYWIKTTYESYYGVSDLFCDSHDFIYSVCPHCKEEEFEEYEEEEYDEKNY